MKNPENKEDELRKTLRQWRVTEPLPPRFQEQVWRSVEQAEASRNGFGFDDFRLLMERWLTKPALAYAYVAVLLTLGLMGGYLQTQKRQQQWNAELAARYIQNMDPYQKAENP